MRAVSVRVNEVVGVAGYVLPGTHVDVVATASPTMNQTDTTSKVVLANVQVVTAGTRMEQDAGQGQADAGHGRDAARHTGTGRAPRPGEHRRKDSTRASQPARPRGAGDAWDQAGRTPRRGEGPGTGAAPRMASAKKVTGPVTMEAMPAAQRTDRGNDSRRQARHGSREVERQSNVARIHSTQTTVSQDAPVRARRDMRRNK